VPLPHAVAACFCTCCSPPFVLRLPTYRCVSFHYHVSFSFLRILLLPPLPDYYRLVLVHLLPPLPALRFLGGSITNLLFAFLRLCKPATCLPAYGTATCWITAGRTWFCVMISAPFLLRSTAPAIPPYLGYTYHSSFVSGSFLRHHVYRLPSPFHSPPYFTVTAVRVGRFTCYWMPVTTLPPACHAQTFFLRCWFAACADISLNAPDVYAGLTVLPRSPGSNASRAPMLPVLPGTFTCVLPRLLPYGRSPARCRAAWFCAGSALHLPFMVSLHCATAACCVRTLPRLRSAGLPLPATTGSRGSPPACLGSLVLAISASFLHLPACRFSPHLLATLLRRYACLVRLHRSPFCRTTVSNTSAVHACLPHRLPCWTSDACVSASFRAATLPPVLIDAVIPRVPFLLPVPGWDFLTAEPFR